MDTEDLDVRVKKIESLLTAPTNVVSVGELTLVSRDDIDTLGGAAIFLLRDKTVKNYLKDLKTRKRVFGSVG